ncbi:tolloid-like protein 2 isoform X2 [Actinia tenebrosa]|uniref:Tolloid-like protein 2 isoform X2 n=1 Tax=Actinia tenebrosa TaxID=6105 RepID=A0A6P8IUB8_ACTTE|nr:tolloid-like protein 2 isoform X2 [Actinia tenebrosa]XP_031569778.1 tolloid-like protein 2 isoform X2 [Actinia tenebrosa]
MLQVIFFFTLLGAGRASWCKNVTELTEYSDIFSSPLHAEFYPTDTTCVWKITAPPSHFIKLSFTKFHLENCKNCDCDYVTVYDVTQHNDNVTLGKFCGKNKPRSLYSSGKQLIVVFKSDHGDSGSGFLAAYTSVQKGHVCQEEPNVLTKGGVIVSPDYSSTYPSNTKCTWLIKAEPGSRIKLNFISFRVENCSAAPGRCQCDFVEVRDGNSSSSNLIGRFCGSNTPPKLYSSGGYLLVMFKSDGQINKRGFVAEFSTEKQGKNSCPADWRYPFQCPQDYWSRVKNITQVCCYDNQANCCKPGGSHCADSGASQRSYCPRPRDNAKLTRCCMEKEKPSCCLGGASVLQINRFELVSAVFISLILILVIR